MAYTRLGLGFIPVDVLSTIPNSGADAAIAAARAAVGAKPTTSSLIKSLNDKKIITSARVSIPSQNLFKDLIPVGGGGGKTGTVLLAGGVAILVIGGIVAAAKKLKKKI